MNTTTQIGQEVKVVCHNCEFRYDHEISKFDFNDEGLHLGNCPVEHCDSEDLEIIPTAEEVLMQRVGQAMLTKVKGFLLQQEVLTTEMIDQLEEIKNKAISQVIENDRAIELRIQN